MLILLEGKCQGIYNFRGSIKYTEVSTYSLILLFNQNEMHLLKLNVKVYSSEQDEL